MKKNGLKTCVIIPAYNEEANIKGVIEGIPRNINGIDCVEILVIDDGSNDNTVQVAKDAGADEIISHSTNKGLGAAFRTGLDASLEKNVDIIVSIDADGQFNSKDIPKLIEPILNDEADFVTASRFMDKSFEPDMQFIRKFGNKIVTKIINILTNQEFTDTQCGFRAYSKKAALKLNIFGDYTYTQEVFLNLVEEELRIKEIPLEVIYKDERKSRLIKNPLSYAINVILIIIKTIRDYKPLKFFGIPGLFIFSIGLLSGLFIFIRYILTGHTSPYRSLIEFSAVMLIIGFLIIVLALIADISDRQRKLLEKILYNSKLDRYDRKNEEK